MRTRNAPWGLRAVLAQQVEIEPVIGVAEESLRPAVAPLRDVVGQIEDHYARQTSQRRGYGQSPIAPI